MRWTNLTESKKIITLVLKESFVESLMDYIEEMNKTQKGDIPVKVIDTADPIDRKRALKRYKKSFGYYYTNPGKFAFGLKDL